MKLMVMKEVVADWLRLALPREFRIVSESDLEMVNESMLELLNAAREMDKLTPSSKSYPKARARYRNAVSQLKIQRALLLAILDGPTR